jgi:hypothetical protein
MWYSPAAETKSCCREALAESSEVSASAMNGRVARPPAASAIAAESRSRFFLLCKIMILTKNWDEASSSPPEIAVEWDLCRRLEGPMTN